MAVPFCVSQLEASDDALRQAAEFIVGRLEARELTNGRPRAELVRR